MGRKRRKVFKHFRVDVDQIVPMIWTGYKKKLKLINLKDTPHYQYLEGNTEPYANYAGRGRADREHSPKKYNDLIMSMMQNQAYDLADSISFKVEYWFELNKYILLDGAHRLSILVGRGIKNVKAHEDHWPKVVPENVANLEEFKNDIL